LRTGRKLRDRRKSVDFLIEGATLLRCAMFQGNPPAVFGGCGTGATGCGEKPRKVVFDHDKLRESGLASGITSSSRVIGRGSGRRRTVGETAAGKTSKGG